MKKPGGGAKFRAPSGTVTFLFSDIEGSTRRWDRDRAAMQDAVRRHDALMRTAIAQHHGYVFKTVGDEFCAAFALPEDAVAAILDAQIALGAEDFSQVDGLRVRAALHTGTADERDGDYFGPAVNRVARLLAIGHGGQVLVSGIATDLVQGALPPRTSLCDLGEHRLKDLARPEHVYQLLAPDLPAEFPPLRSLDALPNNLPGQLTSFVGREAEIAEIGAMLETHRLVTLVGTGGIGKTRTSLQVAANQLDGSETGVWFIELAPLTSGDYVASTVAQAVGLTLGSDGDPTENLARALKAKHALLVFDNCEHLIAPTACVIAAILRACPRVKVLASSRQGLGVTGEQRYRLTSLHVPLDDGSNRVTASDAGRCAAIALFVERAHAVDKRFAFTDENAAIIVDICRRLDGIPLAIELAAARITILSPRQLRDRLGERFRLLTGGSRDVLPRQQTLRATIDWSHDLLDERERTLFRRLGIFVNGFTLEGATAVGTGVELDELDIFDVLASLVDKSLVLAESAGDALRYRLLESTRVYAREKLAAAGEREVCADGHLRYFHDLVAAAREHFDRTVRRSELNDALATELEDVRAALDWALIRLDPLGGDLLADIGRGWQYVGLDKEGLARIEAFQTALAERDARMLARLSIAVAYLAGHSARRELEFEAATHAVASAQTCGDPASLAEAFQVYAQSTIRRGQWDEAATALGQAEAIPGVSAALRVGLLQTQAFVSLQRGERATAARAFEELRKEHRSLGNGPEERTMALNLAETEHARDHTQRAIALVREVLPTLRAHSDRKLLVVVLANLAGYLAAADDLLGTCEAAREAIRELAAREPESAVVGIAIEHLALAIALGGDVERAAALAAYSNTALQRQSYKREFTETVTHDRLNALLRGRLPPDEFARLVHDGAALTPDAAVTLAFTDP